MRITTTQLREMIDAEVKSALNRVSPSKLVESYMTRGSNSTLWEASVDELIGFAEAYRDLGDAVTEQLAEIIENGADADPDEINPNAVDMIVSALGGVNEELDEQIAAWQTAADRDEDEDEPLSRPRRR